MRPLLFALVIIFASCSPTLNQVLNSPHLAEACATKYPLKDSTGEAIITYLPADNKDYTNLIDSLSGAIYALSLRGYADSIILSDTGRCCEVAREYVIMADSAQREFTRLKNSYKPCKPDTVKKEIPKWYVNTAKEDQLKKLIWEEHEKYILSKADAERWNRIALKALWSVVVLTIILIGLIWVYKGSIFSIFTSLFKRKS